jgi:phage terminase large subunit
VSDLQSRRRPHFTPPPPKFVEEATEEEVFDAVEERADPPQFFVGQDGFTTFDVPPPVTSFQLPIKFQPLLKPYRYKVFYGGRGGAKSVSFAAALVSIAYSEKKLILCAREFQNSIADSVHRTIVLQIERLGLTDWFDIQKSTIISKRTGSQFLFKGLRHGIAEIKSTQGVDICWVEEGQAVSAESWLTLDPTIREAGSEIWVSFNPDQEDDATYKLFITNPPSNASIVKVDYLDNPWFPEVLELQRKAMLLNDPAAYDWVWGGLTRKNAHSTIFNNKYKVETFDEPPYGTQFFHGADWGFAEDPTVLIRSWIRPCADGHGDDLMIDREAYGYHVEIDDIPALFDTIADEDYSPRMWPIFGDNSRPETISYIARQGFDITPADKWQGSVEDGITHLRGFRNIIIHERCKNLAQEARLYSYKVDKNNGKILPIIVDAWNHGWDSVRYSLNGYIQARGNIGVWAKLAGQVSVDPRELRESL